MQQVVRARKVAYTARVTTRKAFSPEVAADATYALQAVVQSGSGTRARLAGGRPAAGKTGTTSDNKDLWFAGFTPQLSAAVWIGYGNPAPVKIDGVDESTGGRISAAIWKAYMDPALAGQPEKEFPPRAYVGRARRDDRPHRDPAALP